MEKIFVTTFNKVIFEKFGRKLLESFVNTKQSIPFFCYVEENLSEYPHFENITYLNIFKEQPECQKFVNRNLKKNKNNSNISYLLDSVRFNYKVFAQNDARKYADKIYFIDALRNHPTNLDRIRIPFLFCPSILYQYAIL